MTNKYFRTVEGVEDLQLSELLEEVIEKIEHVIYGDLNEEEWEKVKSIIYNTDEEELEEVLELDRTQIEVLVLGLLFHYEDVRIMLKTVKNYDYDLITGVDTEYDLGWEIVHNGYMFDLNTKELGRIANYLNYEDIGRDLTYDGYIITNIRCMAIRFL